MKRISLKNVKSTLSRKEMRSILGGYGYIGSPGGRGGNLQTASFWGDVAKTIIGDILVETAKYLGKAVVNDYNSRPGTPYSASERAASQGPY
jgi:hypothetical protein